MFGAGWDGCLCNRSRGEGIDKDQQADYKQSDSWIPHFLLGTTSIELGQTLHLTYLRAPQNQSLCSLRVLCDSVVDNPDLKSRSVENENTTTGT